VAKLLNMGHEKGIIPQAVKLEWVSETVTAEKA